MKLCLSLCSLALVLAGPSPPAQVVTTDHVAGWSIEGGSDTGKIDVQDIDGGCKTARRICDRVLSLNVHGMNGGGTAWDSIVYDAELDLLYVGTGNGSPWTRQERSPGGGDNLYLCSILALRPDTGGMRALRRHHDRNRLANQLSASRVQVSLQGGRACQFEPRIRR